MADAANDVTQQWELIAARNAELMQRLQSAADNLHTQALTAADLEAAAAYSRAASWAEGVAGQYGTVSDSLFMQAAALETSAIVKVAPAAAQALGYAELTYHVSTGDYREATKDATNIALALLLTPLAIAAAAIALPAAGSVVVGVVGALIAGGIISLLDVGVERLLDGVGDSFNLAQVWRPCRDPLVLDLNGNGIETSSANPTNPVLFDHNGSGVKTGSGWLAPSDGFLVMDRYGNGTIDSGRELFGDSTLLSNGTTASDGFAALAELDSNADGMISAADSQFSQLKVWRDLNRDGLSQASELQTLANPELLELMQRRVKRNRAMFNDGQ